MSTMRRTGARRHTGPGHADRGSVSVLVLLLATTVLLITGLAVDVSGHVHALQQTRAVASEAARVGGQQLQAPTAMTGTGAVADPGQAVAATNAFLAASGVDGVATVTGPDSIHVDVTGTYKTRFLSVIGITSLPVTGKADSRITRSVDGVEQ